MNEASELIASSLLGKDFSTIVAGGKTYSIHPPSIKVIARAIVHFAKVGIEDSYTNLTIVPEIPRNAPHVIRGLSFILAGDVWNWKWKACLYQKELMKCTPKDLLELMRTSADLIYGKDFFDCAALAKNIGGMAATQK